jgi:tRNA-Thr(GGU) m(6)t(6)A37 methyltransferase TsaA
MPYTEIQMKPIGIIHSPFSDPKGMPIQPAAAAGVRGRIVLDPEWEAGLKDLPGFSHLVLIYLFHRTRGTELLVKPFLDEELRGVFATRAPRRPNPIGLSVVKLIGIEGNLLEIEDVDVLDGTPLLDIKPFVPQFDSPGEVRVGWLTGKLDSVQGKEADDRFQD